MNGLGNINMKIKFIVLPVILIAGMFAVAGFTRQKSVIFPEAAALALGTWVMEKPPWRDNHLYLWLSPTMAAITGVAIVKAFSYSPFFMIAGAFIFVSIQLLVLRSDVYPSVSAAILPIIIHVTSWYYPLSVLVLTGVIACTGKIIKWSDMGKESEGFGVNHLEVSENKDGPLQAELIHWTKLLIGVLCVSSVAVYCHVIYAIAPPLIVVFIELAKPNGWLRAKASIIFLLIATGALVGVFWLWLFYYSLHWPIYISVVFSLASILLLFLVLRLPFPPAAAITLLPTLLPMQNIWAYPLDVMLGSGVFILISLVFFGKHRSTFITNIWRLGRH